MSTFQSTSALLAITFVAASALTLSCGPRKHEQTQTDVKKPQTPDTSAEDWKRSQQCSEAAAQFWNRHEWKNLKDIDETVNYTNHYNAVLNRCLVDVHSIGTLPPEPGAGKRLIFESDHIYDALENKVLGAELQTKDSADPRAEPKSIVLFRDGLPVRQTEEVKAFFPWFYGLMVN